ncbi:hypothetical protein TraAM80_05138 [Trypanosoma rangeli]|uniref:Uncharacterized protein n=1 Tax=Trypanosoma rangeli TaxID=5698 RepID=A0A3R7KME3_TRYRA|nr:uncharacterized protein TraAM80_05138 [Trypanosoma rangeli]RNF04540.1 hypothetical protein TraAM80_05138 [Trypanosoma rangeli]|eukprot:RNF04540.1 hypothetical protein TraAM80_05138 [Trypanosoma rangeli]
MQVLASDEGGLCALSPNQGICALVQKGIVVVFMDHIRRASGIENYAPAGSESVAPLPEAADSSTPYRSDAVISTYTALDEIDELQWSPDSTLVTLLLSRRKTVEIVSVYGKCCVARIDAGILGLRAVQWHPSSRAVYWLGLLQGHVLSLVDSQVMRLAGGVKYSAQLAARRQSSRLAVCSEPTSSFLLKRSDPVSEAALIRFSKCHRFLLYVTPRLLHSPLPRNREEEQTAPALGVCSGGVATISFSRVEGDDDKNANSHSQRSEWLVVLSATTHEELHAFPTGRLVQSVSDFFTLACGVALVDYIHGSLVLISHNGAHILHHEPAGVKHVVSSKNGTVLLILFSDACRPVLAYEDRVLALRRISFREDVIMSLQLREIQVLKEPSLAEGLPVTRSRAAAFYQRDVDAFTELNSCREWIQGTALEESLRSHAAISASGQMAAVTLGRWPSWVLVIDILGQQVAEVLLHNEPVLGLCWSPSPCSEYWRFQRCHYMQRKEGSLAVDGGNDASRRKRVPGQEEPLLVTTDNHEAKVFLWLANHATCCVASCEECLDDAEARRKRKQRGDTPGVCESQLPALRLNRVMFGEAAANAVLMDELRGVVLTVAFRMDKAYQ